MLRRARLLTMLALAVGLMLGMLSSGAVFAQDAEDEDNAEKEEQKKVDKYLGVDWGDDESEEDEKDKDKPEKPQPQTSVDLSTALNAGQVRRLDRIKQQAAKGDELAELATKTLAGENKRVKPAASVKQYEAASGSFLSAHNDVERLARSVQDEDAKLTLLREVGDPYQERAVEMLCKAGDAALELGGESPAGIKKAAQLYARASRMDPDNAMVVAGKQRVRNAVRDLIFAMQEVQEAQPAAGEDTEHEYGDTRQDHEDQRRGRDDPEKRGR